MAFEIENILDDDGYPTEQFLEFVRKWGPEIMPLDEFLAILKEAWQYSGWGFVMRRRYKGKRTLELHTGGWSGNEQIIEALLENINLTMIYMKYVKWEIGGHFYFEIPVK